MPLHIYNSLSQKKEVFEPLERGKVRMYVCGITVYDECHLGHARAAVVFDIIYRYLQYLGFDVTYVRNYTDVDDKIIAKSQETGEAWQEITNRYITSYQELMQRLDVKPPSYEPLATEHIQDMLDLIETLEAKGYAYAAGGDVFYAVRKFKEYGKLSHKKIDDLEVGARVEVNEQKEDPLDFALWKAAKPGEPSWSSKWGKGRPGWHIECSAMSMKYLRDSFDIHGGGRDLIFPHHENEIAQSEGATEKDFAKYWIHNGFVNINAEKMSKSLGNIRTISAILDHWDPEVVRYFLLSANYGSPLDFTDKTIGDAQDALERCYKTLRRLDESARGNDYFEVDFKSLFEDGMNDDFNTAYVFGKVFEVVRQINSGIDQGMHFSEPFHEQIFSTLKKIGGVLGVFGTPPQQFLDRLKQVGLSKIALTDDSTFTLLGQNGEIAPGESITAVRFMGRQAYVTTYITKDPLFTIDLSDPSHPKVIGELDVPGYPSHLHVWGDLLISIGSTNEFWGEVILSLFDISDFSQPRLIEQLQIEGSTWSEAQTEHRAFSFFDDRAQLVIPIQSYSSASYAAIYSIDGEEGLTRLGRVDHDDLISGEDGYSPRLRRSLEIGAALYTISEAGIKANNFDDFEEEFFGELFPGYEPPNNGCHYELGCAIMID